MPKFTPGPWRWENDYPGEDRVDRLTNKQGNVILVPCTDEMVGDQWMDIEDADARLIAAAPDLYEALSEALDFIDCDVCGENYRSATGTEPEECCEPCRKRVAFWAILAKADGQEGS